MSGTNTVPGTAPTGAVPFGDYYTRPDIGADAQKYADEVHAYSQRVQHYEGGLKTQAKDVEGMGRALDYLQTRLNLAVASGDEALISTAKERYDQMYDQYKVARLEYARLYGEYEKAHSSYTSAWKAQSDYIQGQKDAEEQWRSSIRDPEAVKADLAAIEAQIKEQKTADAVAQVTAKYGGAQQTKSGNAQAQTYFARPQDIPVVPTYSDSGVSVGAITPELQALLDKQKLLQEEYEWAMYLPYADLMQNEDFAEKSVYNPQERKAQRPMDILMDNYSDNASGWDDPLYEFINGNKEAGGYLSNAGANYYGPDNAIGAIFGRVTEDKSESQQMTEDEIALFNYLYATQGRGAAHTFYNYLREGLNYRERQAEEAYWKGEAQKHPWGASAFSVAMSPVKGLAYLGQLMDYMGDGKIDPNAAYNSFSYVPGAIREQVAEDIKASAKTEFWGSVGSFGYQTAMSMADFLTTTLVSGGNSTMAMVIMGSGAAADTVLEAKDRGLSDNQAFALGTIAGVAEALTEKVSLSALMDLSALEKSAAGYILKNVWEEGAEEVTASLVNTVADVLISQDKSQWQQSIDAYVAQGKTEGQAFGLALADQALALGLDFLGGAISGGVMAGGNVAINKGATAIANRGNKGTQSAPQGVAEAPAAAQPASFQDEVQRQMMENAAPVKAAQSGAVELADPTVQVTQEQWQQGQRLAEVTGRRIRFYTGAQSEHGYFDPKTGEIGVNVNGGDVLAQVFSHELTHSIEQAGAYEKLKTMVLNRMQDTGINLDNAREAKRQQYTRQGKPLPSQSRVDQELVAEYVSRNLLTNEQQIVSLVQQDRTLGQKIVGWIDGVLAKLGNKNAQERAFLSKARKLYAKALRQTPNVGAVQTATAAATEGTATEAVSMEELDTQLAAGEITDEEYAEIRQTLEEQQEAQYTAGERKYSLASNAKAELHKALYDLKYRDDVRLRDKTPGIMLGHKGVKNLPMAMKASHIRENIFTEDEARALGLRVDDDIHYHGLGEEFFLQVIDGLDNVKEAYRGTKNASDPTRREDYFLLVSEFTDEAGNTVNVPVYINRHSQVNRVFLETNKISTVYGKTALRDYIMMQVKNGNLVRIKRKSTESSERAVHMTAGYRNDASTQIIADDRPEVKKFSLAGDVAEDSAGRKLAAGQIAYFRDSKARDASGRLLVLFHQTGEVFTVFDMLRQGAGTNDSGTPFGVFLKSSSADIGLRGKHQMELYANITNPIYASDRSDLKRQLEQLSPEYAAIAKELSGLDATYSAKIEDAKSNLRNFMEEWRKANPDASRRALYDVPEFDELFNAEDVLVDEWTEKSDALARRAKEALTQSLRNAGYDGVILKNDAGSFGRSTDAYIALDSSQVKNVDNLEPTADPDIRYSLADDSQPSADYLDAVNRGDMDAAQQMVDEAAKTAGYTIKAYHGTSSEFTTFQRGNKRTRGSLNFGDGFYFSPSRSFAENYTTTGRVIEGYLKLSNPYEVYGTRFDRSDLERIGEMADKEATINNVTEVLRQLGYDGIIAKDYNGTTNPVNQYVIFDANQVKTADPVTYDDKGNVIPLSQRFDISRDDIRYSLADEAEDGGKMPLAEFMGQYAQEKAEPWRQGSIVDDETVRQAHKAGYPVIDGVQVVPFVTWVRCTDPMPGSGEPRNNYGLVTGLGKEGQLLVSFRNKGEKVDTNAEDAQAPSKKQNVPIAVEYLEPVRGKYQMTKAEWESLEQAMPEDPEQMDLTDEEWAEIEELRNRAEATEEEVAAPVKEVHREDLPAKAKGMLETAERKLLWEIADKLGVPKLAGREYLQPIIQEMADEYLRTGSISPESRQMLFEKAYSQAVVVDAEFYNQYKDLKDHLRTNAVTISDRDKADIADFNDFRKRAFGTLRIVNEGGLPVDAAYQELHSMAPELFPESITHPADQLMRMYDVAKSIQVTEKTVQDYYGEEEPEYRKWARNEFEEAIGDATGKLWEVKRFAEDKAARESDTPPATAAEAMEAYLKLKKARREYEKANAKNLLTERDQQQVGRLLRHEITLDDLQPGVDNVKGITAVFEAKQEYEKLCKQIAEYKRHLRGQARKKADVLLKTANNWKDKRMGIAYSRETMERNIYDIVPDKALAKQIIDQYFAPVHQSEAGATRFKNDYRDRVRALDLSRKVEKGNLVSEAHAVQLLGEAQDNIRMLENARGRIKQRDGKNRSEWEAVVGKLWAENPNLDRGKIEKAVKDFRYIYDTLFQKMNEVRVANGYEPINYRSGYFPHFQPGDSDSILAQFGRALGIDTRIDALPTTINGLTHTFKPGIQWFGNAQERLGFNTAYDAVEGFDKYIEGCASVIYHTENIQNLRALASQIRYRTSDEGIRQQVDEIYERQGITDEEKQKLIQDIYAHGQFTLSNFVTELDEYTNLLANKKSRYDRAIEAAMGRRVYSVLKAWEARVGANMIAGNLTSALTNFIPLTQAGAQMGKGTLLRGMWNTLQSYRVDDGVVGISTFLTNRRGSDPLVRTWAQNASSVLGKPMELIDGFVSESIVRGAYLLNQQQGMSDAEAMAQADAFAASVMADRSKGAMPTLMQAGNPLFKAFTQFQLEVNNQFSEVFKDIPRRFREKGLAVLAWVLLKYFLGAWLYNELYEKLIGRRPALDPIGMLCDAYDDLQTDGFGTAGKNLAMNALEQLPFSSGLTMIGVELDGGRIPASSAVPDFTALWDAATTEGWSGKKRWKEIQDELNKLAYVVTPFGGNQASKIWKGVKAFVQGGSYNVDAEGNEFLQYPVYKDEPKDAFWSLVKASFLGKSSLDTAQDWVDSGFKSLNAKQTAAYQDMIAAGVKDRDAYALIQSIQGATETEEQKKAAVQRNILRESKVSGDGKAIVYYGLMASDKERELMDTLGDLGADSGATVNALMDLKDAGSKAADKLGAISKAKLTDEEKAVLVGSVIGTDLLTEDGGLTQYAKFSYAIQNGMGVDQYIHYRTSGASIDHYLELRDMGVPIEDAMDAGIALQELKNSVQDPSTVQKWQAVIGSSDDPEVQMASLAIVMTDSQYAKVAAARGFGVSAKTYVDANATLQKYDADGNGSFTQAEVTRAINSMKLTTTQRAVLWQLMTGSSSAKKNPYSEAIGQRVIDALAKAKAAGEKTGHSFEDEVMRQIVQNMGR